LLIAAAAINTNHKIWGHELQGGNKDNQQVKIVEKTDDGSTIIFTKTLAKDIIGYGGNVPLKTLYQRRKGGENRALPNAESPDFFDMVKKEVLPKWNGKTVDEALKTHVDGVSGATYSSRATIQVGAKGTELCPRASRDAGNGAFLEVMNLKYAVIILVLLAAAIIPSVVHNKRYRMAQLALNVAVLGLWGGMFISYTPDGQHDDQRTESAQIAAGNIDVGHGFRISSVRQENLLLHVGVPDGIDAGTDREEREA
jgi:hypothetical protein